MTWFTKAAQGLTWACAIAATGLLASVAPLQADGQTPIVSPEAATQSEPPEPFSAFLTERRLVLVQHALTDLDADGDKDVVAHVTSSKPKDKQGKSRVGNALVFALIEPQLSQGLRVLAELPNGMLCPDCPIPTRDGSVTFPEQQLRSVGNSVEICEAWGKEWRVGHCDTVVIDAQETLRVQRHVEANGWQPGPTESSVELDFAQQEGLRTYTSSPLEAGFPTVSRATRFAMLVAHRIEAAPTLDGRLVDSAWKAAAKRTFAAAEQIVAGERYWRGPEDLSFSVRSVWSKEGVWLAVDVADERLVRDACTADRALVRSDRVEVWLDVAADLRVAGNEPWVEEHRRVYHEDPVRHRPDDALFVFAVGPGLDATCASQYLPRDEEPWLGFGAERRSEAVRAELSETSQRPGYQVEAFLPAALFGLADMDDFEGRWPGAGMTVVVHDVDDESRPQDATQLATSTLVWGDPFTLGLIVMPTHEDVLPSYPFDWSDWMR